MIISLEKFEDAKEYWVSKLSGELNELALWPDFYDAEGSEKSTCERVLTMEITGNLIRLSKRNDLSLFTILLTALKILLYKYTGQNDIVVVSPTLSRSRQNYNKYIALRDLVDPALTFKEFLLEVTRTVVAGYRKQYYPIEKIVKHRDIKSSSALFKIILLLEDIHPKESIARIPADFINDIVFSFSQGNGSLACDIRFNSRLFKEETIRGLFDLYSDLLSRVPGDLNKKIKDLELSVEVGRKELLGAFNAEAGDYRLDRTMDRLFADQAADTPHSTAVEWKDRVLSYRALETRALRLAAYLNREHHIRADHLVGVLMDRSLDLFAAILGILESGGGYVPIDPSFPEGRIKDIISDSGLGVLISQKRHIKLLNRLQWECAGLHTFLCVDTASIYDEEEWEKNELMDGKLWDYVAESGEDEIRGGGWLSSYTGEPFSEEEMEEYGANVLEKLGPYLHGEARVLEIGCASGITMYRIAPRVGFYYGIDLSGVMIERNRRRVESEGHGNIVLEKRYAHEIEGMEEGGFDVIILNSVVQAFHGHHYLRRVLQKCIDRLSEEGVIFVGDVMDQDRKGELVEEMNEFKRSHGDKGYQTKTDFSAELFVSRSFFEDLMADIPRVREVEFSDKKYSLENELTRFRYDVVMRIGPVAAGHVTIGRKHKRQHDLRHLEGNGGDVSRRSNGEVGVGHLAYVIYTSGTSGKPKGVMIEHRGVGNLREFFMRSFDIFRRDRVLQFSNICFDASVWELCMSLLCGGVLCVIPEEVIEDYEIFCRELVRRQVSILTLPPGYLSLLPAGELRSLRKLITAGSETSHELVRRWQDSLAYINAYGPTEGTICATHWEAVGGEGSVYGGYRTIPIGRPLPNTGVFILDADGHIQCIGGVGELCMSGVGLGRGYLNGPELSGEKFIFSSVVGGERLYRSGDMCRWLWDGNVEYLGRMDQQVKVRGYRIELSEIESHLRKLSEVSDAVVLARAGGGGERELCGYVVFREGVDCGDEEFVFKVLREELSWSLPDYMIPGRFVRMEKFPLTAGGKVDRERLPEPELSVGEGYIGAGDEIEERLVEIWSEVLRLDRNVIGVTADFFQLGGHSLRATILISLIRKEFDIEFPLGEVFRTPNIRGLARFIKHSRKKSIYDEIKPVEKREYYPQSSAQKRLFFLDRFENIGTSYNMPFILKINGKPDKERYGNAVRALIARHEALRTSFELIDDEPVQVIHDGVDFEVEEIRGGNGDIKRILREFVQSFDLSEAPLLRFGVVELSAEEHLLLYDMHHIVGDGTSVAVLTDEFEQLYAGEGLSPSKIQYKDFSQWQNQLFRSGKIREQEEYWQNLYSGEIPRLNLPTDFPREGGLRFEGASYRFDLGHHETRRFTQFTSEKGVTLYMNLLAVFYVLLHKYTRQEDIVVGSGTAGRPHADLQNVIGMFVNTLPVRNYPQPEKSYRKFLNEVKDSCVKAFENQDMQFEELVSRINLERDSSRNPLFDVELNVQNFEMPANAGDDIKKDGKVGEGLITSLEYENKTSKFDLILYAVAVNGGIFFELEYSTALFRRSTMKKMAQRYIEILEQVMEDEHIQIGNIILSHDVEFLESTTFDDDQEDFKF